MVKGIHIDVVSDSSRARADLNKLRHSVGNIEATTNSVTKAFRGMILAAGGIGGALLAGGALVKAGDQLQNIENQLKVATRAGQDFGKLQRDLAKIAKSSRGSFDSVATTYSKMALAIDDSVASTDDLLLVTQAITRAARISGASNEDASRAIRQLGQSMTTGTLNAEEYMSILEGTPEIVRQAAKGMGISTGELTAMVKDAKINVSAIDFFEGLLSQVDEIDSKFNELGVTVGEAMTVMRDSRRFLIGNFTKGLGLTGGLSERILALSDLFDLLAESAEDFGRNLRTAFGLFPAIGSLVSQIGAALAAAFDFENVTAMLQKISSSVGNFVDGMMARIGHFRQYMQAQIYWLSQSRELEQIRVAFSGAVGAISSYISDLGRSVSNFGIEAWAKMSQSVVRWTQWMKDGVVGVLSGFSDGVIAIFSWIKNILVDNSIWPDNMKLIVDWAVWMKDKVMGVLHGFRDLVLSLFDNIRRAVTVFFSEKTRSPHEDEMFGLDAFVTRLRDVASKFNEGILHPITEFLHNSAERLAAGFDFFWKSVALGLGAAAIPAFRKYFRPALYLGVAASIVNIGGSSLGFVELGQRIGELLGGSAGGGVASAMNSSVKTERMGFLEVGYTIADFIAQGLRDGIGQVAQGVIMSVTGATEADAREAGMQFGSSFLGALIAAPFAFMGARNTLGMLVDSLEDDRKDRFKKRSQFGGLGKTGAVGASLLGSGAFVGGSILGNQLAESAGFEGAGAQIGASIMSGVIAQMSLSKVIDGWVESRELIAGGKAAGPLMAKFFTSTLATAGGLAGGYLIGTMFAKDIADGLMSWAGLESEMWNFAIQASVYLAAGFASQAAVQLVTNGIIGWLSRSMAGVPMRNIVVGSLVGGLAGFALGTLIADYFDLEGIEALGVQVGTGLAFALLAPAVIGRVSTSLTTLLSTSFMTVSGRVRYGKIAGLALLATLVGSALASLIESSMNDGASGTLADGIVGGITQAATLAGVALLIGGGPWVALGAAIVGGIAYALGITSFDELGNRLKTGVNTALEIIEWDGNVFTFVGKFTHGMAAAIVDFVTGTPGSFDNAAKEIGNAILEGLKSAVDWGAGIVDAIWTSMKQNIPGLESLGRFIGGEIGGAASKTFEATKFNVNPDSALGQRVAPSDSFIEGYLNRFGPVTERASGGYISGPGGPRSDSIPAMLSNGEYVVNAAATSKFGPLLEAINSGSFRGFSTGGEVGDIVKRLIFGGKKSVEDTGPTRNPHEDTVEAVSEGTEKGIERSEKKRKKSSGPAYAAAVARVEPSVAYPHSAMLASYNKELERLDKLLEANKISAADYNMQIEKAADLYNNSADAARAWLLDEELRQQESAKSSTEAFKQSVNSAIYGMLTGETSFKDGITAVLDQLTSSILSNFVDSFTESMFKDLDMDGLFEGIAKFGQQIGESILGWFSGGSSGGSGGGFLSSIGSMVSGWFGGGAATGGYIRGPGGPRSDSVPMWLSNGEYVVNAAATRRNRDLLDMLNAGGMADGGFVNPNANVPVVSIRSSKGESRNKSVNQFNIQVTGDVSTQTKQQIIRMTEEIALRTNQYNREKGYKS